MFFEDAATLGRTLLIVPLAYAALLVTVRLSGKRTLSKLNAFDLVVTVALGSTLASVAVSPDVTLASGALVFTMLAGAQYSIALLSSRMPRFQRLVKAQPTLLLREGRLLDDAMRQQRVTRSEMLQAARQSGFSSLGDIAFVVLETDGSLSVIAQASADPSALADVDASAPDKGVRDDPGR